MQPILLALLISFLIQVFFFALAAINKTDKFTDLSYGLTFIAIALFFLFRSRFHLLQITLFLMILFWGLRLISYLFMRILKIKKDSRFDEIRDNPLKFAQFWFFQAISVWVIMLPAVIVLTTDGMIKFTTISILGLAVWLVGLMIEATADQQKFEFKNQPENRKKWTNAGLWQYSRHPNYFGEMLCWWGVFIFCLPILSGLEYIAVISPLYITTLLLFVTGVPPLEKRYDERFKDNEKYQEYKQRTNLLVPLPVKMFKSC